MILPIIALDFDGVLRNKETDTPVMGSREAVEILSQEYEVVVFTARTDLDKVYNWLEDNSFPHLKVSNKKPIAEVYVDDHGYRFCGDWKTAIEDLQYIGKGWNDDFVNMR